MSGQRDLIPDAGRTALVVIDLQQGIVGRGSAPHAGLDVVARANFIAAALRKAGGLVVWVHVTPSSDNKDALKPPADVSAVTPPDRPANWADLVPEVDRHPEDLFITKRQWGAFYGTELDLQLRRRGVDTIILCGISTNIGVESTARYAYELGYSQVFVEDATAARTAEEHEHTMKVNFPRMGRVRSTAEVVEALRA